MYRGEGHLTEDDAERFANGEMDDPEMCEADFHQGDCKPCQDLLNAKGEQLLAERKAAPDGSAEDLLE